MLAANNSFRMPRHARRIAHIVGLMTLALVAGIAGRFYLDLQDFAQDRVVEVGATYMPYDNVAAMTPDADLVLLGRVTRVAPRQPPSWSASRAASTRS
jgi:hypothetical protein